MDPLKLKPVGLSACWESDYKIRQVGSRYHLYHCQAGKLTTNGYPCRNMAVRAASMRYKLRLDEEGSASRHYLATHFRSALLELEK